jgi:Protein of unknown function (DUF2589)
MFKWIKNLFSSSSGSSSSGGGRTPEALALDPRDSDMPRDSLSSIIRGIHHAAASTQNLLAQQYIAIIDQFFDQSKDDSNPDRPKGTLIPKMVRIQIDDHHYSMLPLITLVSPKGLYLKEMKVNLSVKVEEAESKVATSQADNYEGERTSFKVAISPTGSREAGRPSEVTDIEITFMAMPPAEGMMKIIDEYKNASRPVPIGSKPALSDKSAVNVETLSPDVIAPDPPQVKKGD